MIRQKGFTLVEQLVVISILGAIVLVVVGVYVQIWKGRQGIAQTSVGMTDVDSAVHWLTRDLVLAQTSNLTDGAAPVSSVNMTWEDLTHWAGDTGVVSHYVTYMISGKQLIRNYDGEVSIVSRYLTQFGISIDGKIISVTVTSRAGLPSSEVTQNFMISERADLVAP